MHMMFTQLVRHIPAKKLAELIDSKFEIAEALMLSEIQSIQR